MPSSPRMNAIELKQKIMTRLGKYGLETENKYTLIDLIKICNQHLKFESHFTGRDH